MTTISTLTTRRNRAMAATMLTAAVTGLLAVGGLAAAAPADAAEHKWVAIAYSPVDKDFGYAHAATEEQAATQALINCNEWQGFCALAVVAPKGNCVALATRSNGQEYVGAKAKDRPKAINAALAGLPGGEIKFSYCM